MRPRRVGTGRAHALAGLVVASTLLLGGCTGPDVDVEGVQRWQDAGDEAFRLGLAVAAEELELAPDDDFAGLADTQACGESGRSPVRHRVDATLDLAGAVPDGFADRVRAAVPADYDVTVEMRPDAVVIGVVSGCREMPQIQAVEVALEGRYRVGQ